MWIESLSEGEHSTGPSLVLTRKLWLTVSILMLNGKFQIPVLSVTWTGHRMCFVAAPSGQMSALLYWGSAESVFFLFEKAAFLPVTFPLWLSRPFVSQTTGTPPPPPPPPTPPGEVQPRPLSRHHRVGFFMFSARTHKQFNSCFHECASALLIIVPLSYDFTTRSSSDNVMQGYNNNHISSRKLWRKRHSRQICKRIYTYLLW